MAQVITDQRSLNAHQHRFCFTEDLGCECGAAEGAVEHFRFYCPKYERDDLVIVSLELEVTTVCGRHLSRQDTLRQSTVASNDQLRKEK